jgi:hypothetical protein
VPPGAPPCASQKHEKARREAAGGQVEEVDENFVRLYWEQMLQVGAACSPCSSQRLMAHSKPALAASAFWRPPAC